MVTWTRFSPATNKSLKQINLAIAAIGSDPAATTWHKLQAIRQIEQDANRLAIQILNTLTTKKGTA